MAFSTLDGIGAGSRVFIDASIFIYHFTATSFECHGDPRKDRGHGFG